MKALLTLLLLGSLTVGDKRGVERPLPWNADAERAVLGAVLLENKAADEVGELKPEHFFDTANQRIFGIVTELHENNRPADLVTVTEILRRRNELKSVGGAGYVSSLLDGVPKISNVAHYSRIVRQEAARRAVIHAAELLQERAFDGTENIEEVLDGAGAQLAEITFDIAGRHSLLSYQQAAAEKVKSFSQPQGPRILTSVQKLDSLTGGFMAGEMVLITAMTGAGKSLFASQIRAMACAEGFHGLYCSGEMFAPHIAGRELATIAGVSHRKMRMPERYTEAEVKAIVAASATMCDKCCIMDGELEIGAIRREARRVKKAQGLSLVVLDYDELIDAPGKNDIERQNFLARESKRIGIELGCPVFLISQLRKSLTPDEAKRPSLDRIYGSGMKVKHASFVLFVHREFVRNLEGDETDAQIFVLKSRDTKAGKISAKYNIKTLRFDDAPELGEGAAKPKKGRKGREAVQAEPAAESEAELFRTSEEEGEEQ